MVNVKDKKTREFLWRSVKFSKYTRIAVKILNEFDTAEQEFSGIPNFNVRYIEVPL